MSDETACAQCGHALSAHVEHRHRHEMPGAPWRDYVTVSRDECSADECKCRRFVPPDEEDA